MPDDATARFYDELSDEYDLILADWAAGVRNQGETLERLLRDVGLPASGTVLDCTCGIGTQAIGLALRGLRVHGTDISPGAISRARREAEGFGVEVPFDVADIRTLDAVVHDRFDAVVTFDNSLAHLLDDVDLARAAAQMAARTRPGGLVVASVRDYDALIEERPTTTPVRVHGPVDDRRVSYQLWDWADDSRTYRLEQVILRGRAGAWAGTGRISTLRALRRADLDRAFHEARLEDVRWHVPAATGYYQPVVTAYRSPDR